MTLLNKRIDAWKKVSGQHGPLAWNRFAMLELVQLLSKNSDDFIFKGGHLLWVKIKISRSTTDLDFAIKNKHPESYVREQFEKAAKLSDIINFEFTKITPIEKGGRIAFKIFVKFSDKEDSNVANHFSMDIVEDPNIDTKKIRLGTEDVLAASSENILLDKISACHEKGTGNTRMKDYDDLIRFLYSNEIFEKDKLAMLAIKRKIHLELSRKYAGDETEAHWANYRKRTLKKGMNDLPETLYEAIEIINKGLKRVLS